MFAFLYGKAYSKEICEEISVPSFFRKMLMLAFLLRFKTNYLENMRGYLYFSLGIPIALVKIYFFRVVLTWRQKPLYLVGTVLKRTTFKGQGPVSRRPRKVFGPVKQ